MGERIGDEERPDVVRLVEAVRLQMEEAKEQGLLQAFKAGAPAPATSTRGTPCIWPSTPSRSTSWASGRPRPWCWASPGLPPAGDAGRDPI